MPPRRWQFSLGQIMLAVAVAAFDSLVILQGALILKERGVVLLRNYVANTLWPTLAVIVSVLCVWWMVRRNDWWGVIGTGYRTG